MMEGWMIRILNLSFSASCVAVIVMGLRLCLKRLPRGYSYALWLVVLFRFLCPVTIPAPLSLLPVNPEPIRQEMVYKSKPTIETGVVWVDRAVNGSVMKSFAPESPVQSANPLQIWLFLAALVWGAGVAVFLLYHGGQYLRLRRLLTDAVPVEDRGSCPAPVYESSRISGAFTLGLLRPAVYLPAGLSGESRDYILLHEGVHIRRRDALVKLLWLAAVAVHWFNPLSWVSFRLMCGDMEMSCDEQVLRLAGEGKRKDYSQVLLSQAQRQSGLLLPLAFGKNNTYRRVKHILSYHKPGVVLAVAAAVVLAAVGVGLLVSPKKEDVADMGKSAEAVSIIGGADGPTSIFVAGKTEGEEASEPTWQRQRPESGWLASVRLKRETAEPGDSGAEGAGTETADGAEISLESPSGIVLDFASDNSLIFHGDFGMFSFNKEADGVWRQQMFVMDSDLADGLSQAVDTAMEGNHLAGKQWESNDGIHREDRLISAGENGTLGEAVGGMTVDYAAKKLADGRIAVLGTSASGSWEGRLIDLFYGYYDPKEQVLHQVYLFLGDGKEIVNEPGRTSECRFLFERDGYDYYVQTPKELRSFEKEMWDQKEEKRYSLPYGRLELVRSRDQKELLLDPLLCMQRAEDQKVILTEDRVVYLAAAGEDYMDFKRPGLVSIRLDGTERRVADTYYQVFDGLTYADGCLYYMGWTNDSLFPRPLMRMRPDFTEQQQIGEISGSLLAVRENETCLYWDWEKMRIMTAGLDQLANRDHHFSYLADGETSRSGETCHVEVLNSYTILVTLESGDPASHQEYRLVTPPGVELPEGP